jgi:hypothetical protein
MYTYCLGFAPPVVPRRNSRRQHKNVSRKGSQSLQSLSRWGVGGNRRSSYIFYNHIHIIYVLYILYMGWPVVAVEWSCILQGKTDIFSGFANAGLTHDHVSINVLLRFTRISGEGTR